MAKKEHLKILDKGVTAFNEWRDSNPDIIPEFETANLSGTILYQANLSGANLSAADLSRADLREANLSAADLIASDLSEANLSEANLSRANLSAADLSRADLSRAELRWADFSRVNLSGTKLNDAVFGATLLADLDLHEVVGIEFARHYYPSTIGVDTIYRSDGEIPHKFLEGAGVPNIFIEYMSSLTGKAFQFYSCFISYSTDDKDFAERIYADLRKEGVRCWFAPEDIKGGKKIHLQLDEAIRYYDKLLLILSEKSMSSDWVANEIRWARKREKQDGKQKLFPVGLVDYEKLKNWELFDAGTATDLAAEVRSYYIPDFTRWKYHDSYQNAFKRLLRDLQAEEQ